MARIIDLGLKKPDDPIFTEGIGIVSIRKPAPSVGPRLNSPELESAKENPATAQPEVPENQTRKEPPHEPST